MVPLPCTGSNVRSVDMQFTQVAYGGCWKCPQDWQRCSASTPRFAASQKGFVHSFGTGIGRVTLLQSLIVSDSLCDHAAWEAARVDSLSPPRGEGQGEESRCSRPVGRAAHHAATADP